MTYIMTYRFIPFHHFAPIRLTTLFIVFSMLLSQLFIQAPHELTFFQTATAELDVISINLTVGWNLIVPPGNVTGMTTLQWAQDIEQNTSLFVLAIEDFEGSWVDFLHRDGNQSNGYHLFDGTGGYPNFILYSDFSLANGESYFVYLAENESEPLDHVWECEITPFSEMLQDVLISVGWNNLAMPYSSGGFTNASDVLDSNSNFTKICGWSTGDTWAAWDGSTGTDFCLQQRPGATGMYPGTTNPIGFFVLSGGSTTWSPLASGLLTGKYNDGIPEDSRATIEKYDVYEKARDEQILSKTRALAEVAKDLGVSQAQMSIAWILKNPNVSTVITGASRVEQVRENMKAVEVVDMLTPDVMERIEKILE